MVVAQFVGRAVIFGIIGRSGVLYFTVNCIEKTKLKKRPGMAKIK